MSIFFKVAYPFIYSIVIFYEILIVKVWSNLQVI